MPRLSGPLLALLAAAATLAAPAPAPAMQVEPVLLEMSTSGPAAGSTLRVTNTSHRQTTIQVYVIERLTNRTGPETTRPADTDFVVFPPQALIAPGASQNITLQWSGGPIAQSRSYHVAIEQLPIEFAGGEAEGSGIQIAFQFNATVHVSPPEALADLRIVEQSSATMPDGRPGLRLVVRNLGSRYGYLSDRVLELDGTRITGEATTALLGNTLVTPGADREFLLPHAASAVALVP